MCNKDYEKAKQECWEEYAATFGVMMSMPNKAFEIIFSRAYRLGMEAAKKEMLTANVVRSQPNVESLEETPAEPRFDIGAKVKYRGNIYKVAEIRRSYEQGYYYIIQSVLTGQGYQVFESDLVPCTEPQEDKHFDNILKDGFRSERRLNLAVRIVERLLVSPIIPEVNPNPSIAENVALAYKYADALLAEAEKGGSK